MAVASPQRHILGEKPANTLNIPIPIFAKKDDVSPLMQGLGVGTKRRIDQVDTPEQSPVRRCSYDEGDNRRHDTRAHAEQAERDENNDTDSQKSSMSSLINFDPEDDTMVSQQTAATEITEPGRTIASVVSAISPLLEDRLTNS